MPDWPNWPAYLPIYLPTYLPGCLAAFLAWIKLALIMMPLPSHIFGLGLGFRVLSGFVCFWVIRVGDLWVSGRGFWWVWWSRRRKQKRERDTQREGEREG
jgi:hypothetical protein